jgi:hypothetical protein
MIFILPTRLSSDVKEWGGNDGDDFHLTKQASKRQIMVGHDFPLTREDGVKMMVGHDFISPSKQG